MVELDPLLALAAHVAREAAAFGVDTALIGALAMAHHGYVRATVDVDFAAATDFDAKLRPLAAHLRGQGLTVDLRAPDADDPLAGVLRVRASADGDPVDVVNFRRGSSAGALAVARAERRPDGFAYARLPELVALKLYAGSRFDQDDVTRLLAANPDADPEELRRVCAEAGVAADLQQVLERLRGP